MLSESMLERSRILVANLEHYIKANGFAQRELAEMAGIMPTTLNNWMRNRAYPSPENLLKLAKVLGCEVADLTEKETYHDDRKRYLTIGQAAVLQAYTNDRSFQQICDTAIRLLREKRLQSYAAAWINLVEKSNIEDDQSE